MTTSNSVGILCISSVICLTCCSHIIRSFKTHLPEVDNSAMASRTRSINVIRLLHNNGSQARTTYIPDLIETKDLSTRTDYEVESIINDSVKKKKTLHNPEFRQCQIEQKDAKKYEIYYKLINKPIQNNTRKDKYYTVIHMFKVCYMNSSKNYNYLGLNESIIKTRLFKPSLKIRHAIVRKGSQLSKKALVNVVCRLPCHKNDSFKTKILENNETTDGNTQYNYINSGKFPKFLNLFTFINFANEVCVTNDGNGGVCYHPSQCQSLGGKPGRSCAQGYGVCCYIERSCGERTALNGTYFTGTKLSNIQNSSIYICMFHIYKSHPSVKQLYIYLEHFEFAPPMNGNCVIDRFVVTGQNANSFVPELCGINSGKHFYVDVDSTLGPVSLTVLSSGAQGLPKNFKIRIFQLKEGNHRMVPKNCLQYYTSIQGVVESFNYQLVGLQENSNIMLGYMNNLNYAICIRKEPGYCSITYSNVEVNEKEYPFELVNVDDAGAFTVPIGQAGVEMFNCPDDYIVISGIRLCGYKFNDASFESDFNKNYPVTDKTNGPFILYIHTDSNITGRGFHLTYKQNRCN